MRTDAELIHSRWFAGPQGVPFIPTLGPVHPAEDPARLLADVFSVAGTGRALPYDKDARWLEPKDEHVIAGIFGEPGRGAVIPTLASQPRPQITLYCYGEPGAETVNHLAEELTAEHRGAQVRIVRLCSGSTKGNHAVHIWMHDFTSASSTRPAGVYVLEECFGPLVHSFIDFAERLHADGWGFVREQMRERDLGPILIRIHENRVVGATGPLQIARDSRGGRRLLPQYLGVLPEARGQGHGKALREAVAAWAHQQGAEYELLQTVIGEPADRLHAAQGARCLGTRYEEPTVM